MHKRFVTALISLIACIACLVGFVGCGDDAGNENEGGTSSDVLDVAGKTFVFFDITLSFDESVSQEMKDQLNASLHHPKALYADSTITFDTNGGFTMFLQSAITGTYTQNETTITLIQDDTSFLFTLSGNKLSMSGPLGGYEKEGVTQTVIYTLQESE